VCELHGKLTRTLEAKLGGEVVSNPTILGKLDLDPMGVLTLGLAITLVASQFYLPGGRTSDWVLIAIMLVIGIGAFSGPTIPTSMARTLSSLLALCYGTLPWIIVFKLYMMAPHARFVVLVMMITWMSDTGAYFGGRFLGGRLVKNRPFAPVISPKKTWEGSVVGMVFGVLGACGLNWIYGGGLGSYQLVGFISIFGVISAQLGDLIESAFKRFVGVKDSGTLIPGHGGFLDRVDGTLFCGSVVWIILTVVYQYPL
jgi:phosphatidate cytidylyltransferase